MSIQRAVLNIESLEEQRQPMYFLGKRLFLECDFNHMVESVKVKIIFELSRFDKNSRKIILEAKNLIVSS